MPDARLCGFRPAQHALARKPDSSRRSDHSEVERLQRRGGAIAPHMHSSGTAASKIIMAIGTVSLQ